MAKNKKNIIFSAETAEFRKKIDDASRDIKNLTNELKLNQSQLNGNKDSTDILTKKLELLKKQYSEQTQVVQNTKSTYQEAVKIFGENSKEAHNWKNKLLEAEKKQQDLVNAISETNREVIKQTDNFIKAGNEIYTAGEKIESFGKGLTNVGKGLTKASAVITAGVAGTIKTAIDVESAFTGVEKTVDATENQLNELREGIIKMSKEIPSSAVEISSVAEAAGQLGIQTENILSFSKAMIDLGNSTNLTADDAASQLAKFANITEMSQKDFDKLGSTIVDLGNHFATTEADIVGMAMRLAGAGHQVNFSEGQILGLATALSSVGIEAEMGGSAISKAMIKMENAVEMGGEKLNKVLEKTGKSLRSLELMSTNDTKGFKELAQSLGMTTTEIKQLITAGTNLEDFAKISGMTAEQFKKSWKEDAAGALTAFIKGLGDAETKGESAITLLSEMGLTEVRLRDSLLRAANAGNLFNDAIDTGTRAWKENVALTNEAEKRYGTTESQIKTLKNEIVAIGIEFGTELLPCLTDLIKSSKPLLRTITDLVKKFSSLNSTTKENIIKMGAFALASGPIISVAGKMISGIGGLTKGFGSLTKNIGLAKNGMLQGTSATSLLAKGIVGLANPTTLATVAVIGLTSAVAAYCIYKERELISIGKTIKEIRKEKESRNELIEKQKESISQNVAEIENAQNLWNELKNITDENGKVKDGYEKRATFITSELNQALGTEMSLNDGVIEGYQNIQEEIDKVILKKKAEIYLNSKEEIYSNALKKRADAYEELENLQNKMTEAHKKYVTGTVKEQKKASTEIKALGTAIKEQQDLINGYAYDIANYEYSMSLMQQNTTESLTECINRNIINKRGETTVVGEEINKQIQLLTNQMTTNEELYYNMIFSSNEKDAQIYQNQLTSQKEQLKALADNLLAMTSTTQENSPFIAEAWRTLANNSREVFNSVISQMNPDLRQEVSKMAGVFYSDIAVAEAAGTVANNSSKKFISELGAVAPGTSLILQDTANAINSDTQVESSVKNLGNRSNLAFSSVSSSLLPTGLTSALSGMANTVNFDTQVETATKNLGTRSSKTFLTETQKMQIDTTNNLTGIRNVINLDIGIETASMNLGADSERLYNTEIIKEQVDTTNNLATISSIINEDTSVKDANFNLGSIAKENFLISSDGEGTGINYINGVTRGIQNRDAQNSAFRAVSAFGNELIQSLNRSLDVHSPSKLTTETGINYDLGIIVGVDKLKGKVLDNIRNLGNDIDKTFNDNIYENGNVEFTTRMSTISDNNELFQNTIDNKMQARSIIVNFYPQTITESEMEKAATFIEEIWGKKL